ncbi:MAG TPA: HNH endonuclease family protein, partial [bacterium]|nr:HNH endonuclease family protein [bacterium]
MVFKRLYSNGFIPDTNYGDRFLALVSKAEEGYRLPSIRELKESIVTNNLYSRKRQPLKRLLILLENIGKKELLDYEKDLKKVQIEHIVPQNPAPNQWTTISFEDRERYLHTLGNLTLTFDNQALGNRGFADKKQMLFERSRILLNNELLQYADFNSDVIVSRAESLLDRFVREFLPCYQ